MLLLTGSAKVLGLTCTDLDGAYVYSQESTPFYLGFFGNEFASDSIMNQFGTYGSEFSSSSLRNDFSSYGSNFSSYSATNDFTSSPPIIYRYGEAIAYLTTNTFLSPRTSISEIDSVCGSFFNSTPRTTPQGITLLAASDGESDEFIKLSWLSAEGATGYNIYIAESDTDPFELLATDWQFLSIDLVGFEAGKTYHFAVEPINSLGFGLAAYDTGFLSGSNDTGSIDNHFSATQFLQTTSDSTNETSLHVVNTTDSSQSFTGTLYNGAGEQLGAPDQTLANSVPANGRSVLTSGDLESIFGVESWSGPAMLEVTGSGNFDLMAKLVSPSGLISNTNCVRQDRVLNIEGFDSANMTFVRFINVTNVAMSDIRATLYNKDGNVIGSANTILLDSLGAKQQVWINRNGFATKFGAEWNQEAMLEVDQIEGLQLLNLNFVNGETFFNFSCFEDSLSGTVYLQTTSTSQNVSYTHIVNTADTAQQFTGTLYSGSGERLGAANQLLHSGTIAPKGRAILASEDIEAFLSISPWSGPAMLEVNGTDSFELMTKLTSPSGLISNTNCVRRNQVHNIVGFDSPDVTFIRFINIGNTTLSNIKGTLYASNGDVIGSANKVLVSSLAPKQQVWVNRSNLSDTVGDTWIGEATLEIDSPPDALRLLNLNFINSETFFNFSCYESAN